MTEQRQNLPNLGIGGLDVHYCVLCPRKLWWYTHGMEQEHVSGSSGQENVSLGTLLHQESYQDKSHSDILIDGLIRLDFTDDGKVHEVKKSPGGREATRRQLLYYLYYLKYVKGIETTGVIDYPLQKRREVLELTPDAEQAVEQTIETVISVREAKSPPVVDAPMRLCESCAYQELCWG